MAASDVTFNDTLRRQVRNIPGKIAFRTPSRDWTFAEIDSEARRIANGFLALGIGKGDRVACLTKYVAECTMLVLAANKIGAVCMPVNWRLAGPEIEYIVNHGEAKFMMADAEFLPKLAGIDLPRLVKTVSTFPLEGYESLAQWSAGQSERDPEFAATPEDTALQLYSSGTTGRPKGVELSHRNIIALCNGGRTRYRYDGQDNVTFNAAPVFHIGGLGSALSAFFNSSMTIAYPEFNAREAVAAMSKHRVTHSFLVPAMIHLMLQVPDVEEADFSTLKIIGYGSSPISEKVLTDALRTFRCAFVQNYGLTETTGTVVSLPPEDHDPNGPRAYLLRSAGRACEGSQVRIVEPATGKDVPDGTVGEIWIHSDQNMTGYWRNDKATAEAYPLGKPDGIGWFRSGDAGYLKDGYLYIQDRIKDMIISGGENIYPIEVENVLMTHPGVLDCAVIAIPDEKWGETVKACVVKKPHAEFTDQELIAYTRERLAHYKCPRSVDFMMELPRNPSGKVLKVILREPYWKNQARNVG
jgi:fatty-acyl-CoA synthase